MPLLTAEEIGGMIPLFSGRSGQALARRVMHILSVDKLNKVYDKYTSLAGPQMTAAFMEGEDIRYKVGGAEILPQLKEGPFITISNHPYGSIDGLILIDIFGHLRPDYNVMVNKILARVKTLEPNFISVIPTGEERTDPKAESIIGVKQALNHLRNGSPIGFFPSGAVSDLSLKDRCIRDREWQEPAIRLIKAAHVPIVPVRFFDRNSAFYYLLGLISWKIRLLRLPAEVVNKQGKQPRIGIGPIITLLEQDACKDTASFSDMLRRSVYGMRLPDKFASIQEIRDI